jgi:dethiobiotin synthetase
MPAIFVTATGTDIGKTFVTLGLIDHLRRTGREVAALKPVVSGFDRETMAGSDPAHILKALGRDATETVIPEISPWRFAAPLSPDMAARREGRSIDFHALVGFCRQAMAAAENLLVIEGVGGLMVPFDDRATVLDLMAELTIPAILVAGTYLGTLSHILTAMSAAAQRSVEIRALVLNETPGTTIPVEETIATLRNFCPTLPILTLKRGSPAENQASFALLADLCFA